MKKVSVLIAAVVCFFVIGHARFSFAGQPIFSEAYFNADQAALAGGDNETRLLRLLWYDMLTPPINILSMAGLIGKRKWLETEYLNATDILHNEGLHKLNNTRYKEWWYFDVHDDSGFVMSCSIVFSIVPDHYFLWIYDPKQDKIFVELEQDGAFTVNPFGTTEGQKLTSDNLTIEGRSDVGYTLTFSGKTLQGAFVFSQPIPGRGEMHKGPLMTYYALYQVPKMKVTGLLKNKETGDNTTISGLGYHDHWWGIDSRYTKWEWMQAKFDNGWTSSFYQARYDKRETDLHRYAWLYTPEKGYIYFDNSTFNFHEDTANQQWTASISGAAGTLTLTATKRAERYEFKPVVLNHIPLGEVRYHQYPINTTGTFTDAEGIVTTLNSSHGMLEWDWDAIW